MSVGAIRDVQTATDSDTTAAVRTAVIAPTLTHMSRKRRTECEKID